MDILMLLANYLEDNGIGKAGTDIFVNEMPLRCNQGVLLYTTGEGLLRHTEIANYYRGPIMVVTRAARAQAGCELSHKISRLMDFQGLKLGAITILVSKPEALPQSFGTNDGGYTEWLLPIEVCLTIHSEA